MHFGKTMHTEAAFTCLNMCKIVHSVVCLYTNKKEKKIFLICKEIQNGAVAKSYMTDGLLIYGEYLRISLYIRKQFLIYDFATAPL